MSTNNKSELVLNSDGSIYHLNLSPGYLAETIILVGDPGRVELIATFFDSIELKKHNREIHTITGIYKGKRLSVMSTGMGPDNIEIVVNELDALFNIDLKLKMEKSEKTVLNLIRIGTSGALQADIPVVNSPIVSEYGLGLDGLAYFYKRGLEVIDKELTDSFIKNLNWDRNLPRPYGIKASDYLLEKIGYGWRQGITLTAPGFYAPQGRELRLKVTDRTIVDRASAFTYNNARVTNFEMETSALYVLSAMLGHNALTVCDIIANRITDEFNPNYKESMRNLVGEVLERVVRL
ncbi:MAG: nucleoside phosphorylase [Bacteroidetes bacterium]|nr:nucleoside phosphorylase [Bacteroidota bacterium]